MILIYIADVVWIVALSIMAGASRQAARKLDPATRIPMQLGPLAWRVPRNVALAAPPVLATVVGLALLVLARQAQSADAQLILFGVRAFAASLFAAVHLHWLNAALKTLAREGAVKP